MKKLKKSTNIIQKKKNFNEFLYSNLFVEFRKDFDNEILTQKTIPFCMIYSWFSFRRIGKKTAREIIKKWYNQDFCSRSKYHGIKIEGVKNGE